jgi:capsular exopolysaccharide synthesis family protein
MNDLVRSFDVGAGPSRNSWRQEAPAYEGDALDARRLAQMLLKRKWPILLVATIVVVPAMVATLLTKKLYQSTALVQVDPEPIQVLPYRDADLSRLTQYDMFMKTQEQVLSGQTLRLRVAERLSADGDPSALAEADRLQARLSVRRAAGTQAFTVSYLAPHPEVAAKVANFVAEEYIKLQYGEGETTRRELKELLERELAIAEQRIQVSEKELVAYAQTHNIQRSQPDQTDLADKKLGALADQVTSAEAEVAAARSRVDTLRQASVSNFPAALMTAAISDRTSALLQLEHELTGLRATFGENWPEVVRKRDEIAVVRDQLAREKRTALAQTREQALLDLRAAEAKLAAIGASRAQQAQAVTELQSASIQYNILQRQVETHRKLYEGLLERLRETSVAPGMALGSVRVIEPARPDYNAASPKVLWNLFLAAILGLALGITFVVAHEYWRDSLSTIEDVEHVTVLPVLAMVPQVAAGSTHHLARLGAAFGLAPRTEGEPSTSLATTRAGGGKRLDFRNHPVSAEAVRSLCASILLSRSERPPRVIVVTSTLPGEGKTTVATELGRALAESGARTLLVECDLRRSALGEAFGVGEAGGLSLFLSGHVAKATIHQTPVEQLFVVAAGPTAPNPVALLNSDRMTTFLHEMAASFQFVIMDAPPVLPMADARVLGAKADGVVLIVRAGRTSRSLLRRVCSVLDASGATVLGAVLNGVDVRDMDSSYYSYYGQYNAS